MTRCIGHCAFLVDLRVRLSLGLMFLMASTAPAVTLVNMNFNGPTGLENPGLGPDGVLKDGATIVSGELRTNGSNAPAGSGLDLPLGQLAYGLSGAADFTVSFDFATIGNSVGTLFNADGSQYLYNTIPGFNPDATDPPAGGQAGSLGIYCQAGGIKADMWFIGTTTVGGTFNDNLIHNVSVNYNAKDTLLTLTVDHTLSSTLFVDNADNGGFFRDTSHDLIRLGDINNPDSELGEQGVVTPIAARFDNLLIDGPTPPPVKLIVNRATGSMTLQGLSATSSTIDSISITSADGTLKPSNYHEIDASNPSFDSNDTWQLSVQTDHEIKEIDGPTGANDGATIALNQMFALDDGTHGVWKPFFDEDLQVSVFDRGFGTVIPGQVEYVGNPLLLGDLNLDGHVDLTDYVQFLSGFHQSVAGLLFYDAYFLSDLNGDGKHNFEDFIAFAQAYDTANGAGAFSRISAGVPEPTSMVLIAMGAIGLTLAHVRIRVPRRAWVAILVVAANLFLSSSVQAAKLVEYLFNSNFSDTSGNNRTGVPVGGAIFNSPPTVSGGQLHLGGDIEEGVNVPLGAANPFDGTKSFNIQMSFASTGNSFDPSLGEILLSSSPPNSDPDNNDIQSMSLYVDPQSAGGALVLDYWFVGEVRLPNAGLLNGAQHSIIVSYVAPATLGPVGAPNPGTVYLNVDGQWRGTGQLAPRSPNIATHTVKIGSSLNTIFPFSDYDDPDNPVSINTEFEGTVDNFSISDDAIIPTQLRAQVDLTTGEVKLLGGQLLRKLRYYEITSAGGSLNPANWNSLHDHGLDQIGTGTGQHWDEAIASSTELAESFLLGSSQFSDVSVISLGNIFLAGHSQDLQLVGVTDGLDDINLQVTYINAPASVPGDYNHNGIVDAADYTVWRDSLGKTGANLAADGDGNLVVDQLDYNYWKTRFGHTSGAGSASLSSVPEPRSLWLIGLGLLLAPAARRLRRIS